MRFETAEALLLDVFDLHDRDRIVTFLTQELGKKRGVARGARRKYSRFAGQLQPMAKVQMTWFEKEGRDLVRISSVELVRPAHRLQSDLEGILVGTYMAGHLLEFAQENEASEHLYRLLDSTIDRLLEGVDRNLAVRYFEAWVLRLSGIFPAPHECPLCGQPFAGSRAMLPAGSDALLCAQCAPESAGSLKVGTEVLAFLRRIGRESLSDVAATPPSGAVLEEVENLCCRIRRQFLHHELPSYDVMKRTVLALQSN
jgi:DNA repair protein RecO